jgi:hypothetical protein
VTAASLSEAVASIAAKSSLLTVTSLAFGKRPWTSMDLMDLKTLMRRRVALKEASQFLCRSEAEVDTKVKELDLWDGREDC